MNFEHNWRIERNIFSNVIYNLLLNGIAFLISVISVLFLPKVIGVEVYSYYQLYLFYVSYVAVLTFGWADGVYLKLGGKCYSDLDKRLYSTHFLLLGILESIIYAIIFSIMIITQKLNGYEILVFGLVCISAIIINPRWLLLFIMNAVGKTIQYSFIIVLEKLISIIGIIIICAFGYHDLKYVLLTDIFGKLISFFVCMLFCIDIIKAKPYSFRSMSIIKDIKSTIKPGLFLMISNLSSMLILGIIRFGIEKNWDVITFGKISLLISISNMMMQMVQVISNVLYPYLCRISKSIFKVLYARLGLVVNLFTFTAFLFYRPMIGLLETWLPQYSDSFQYIIILLPVSFYECRTNLICSTYLKALRKEKVLMKCNIFATLLSVILTFISTIIFNNLFMTVIVILIVLALRSLMLEYSVSRLIHVNIRLNVTIETLIILIFIFANSLLGDCGMLIYLISLFFYVFIKKDELIKLFKNLNFKRY